MYQTPKQRNRSIYYERSMKQNQELLSQSSYKTGSKADFLTPNLKQRQQPEIQLSKASLIVECDKRLKKILQQLMFDQYSAIGLSQQMMKDFKHSNIYLIEKELNLDTIDQIKEVLRKQKNTLPSMTIRAFLAQLIDSFDLKCIELEREKNLVIEILAQERFQYAEDLLIIYRSANPDEWFKAFQAQQFDFIPETLLTILIHYGYFNLAMNCLLCTKTSLYSQKIVDILWDKLQESQVSDRDREAINNIRWVVGLCLKEENYIKEFVTQELFELFVQIYIRIEDQKVDFIKIITEFITQMVEFVQYQKVAPNIVIDLSNSGLMNVFYLSFSDHTVKYTTKGYFNLYLMLKNISIYYPDQLGICLTNSYWYQKILFKLTTQTENKMVARLANTEMNMWQASYLQQYFLQDNIKGELHQKLNLN